MFYSDVNLGPSNLIPNPIECANTNRISDSDASLLHELRGEARGKTFRDTQGERRMAGDSIDDPCGSGTSETNFASWGKTGPPVLTFPRRASP